MLNTSSEKVFDSYVATTWSNDTAITDDQMNNIEDALVKTYESFDEHFNINYGNIVDAFRMIEEEVDALLDLAIMKKYN